MSKERTTMTMGKVYKEMAEGVMLDSPRALKSLGVRTMAKSNSDAYRDLEKDSKGQRIGIAMAGGEQEFIQGALTRLLQGNTFLVN